MVSIIQRNSASNVLKVLSNNNCLLIEIRYIVTYLNFKLPLCIGSRSGQHAMSMSREY